MSALLASELRSCFDAVRRGSATPGVDGVTPAAFAEDLDRRTLALAEGIASGTWTPDELRRIPHRKATGGLRWLSIPTVQDRVVIEWLRRGVAPAIEAVLCPSAMAYRSGLAARKAVQRIAELVADGRPYVCLADIARFFDTIQIERLLRALTALDLSPDRALILERLLRAHTARPGVGLAQGSALSPSLSNLALVEVDGQLSREGFTVVRYSDNLCIGAATRGDAEQAMRRVRALLAREGLRLNPRKSRVAEAAAGFLWLGYWVGSQGVHVSEDAIASLVERVNRASSGRSGVAVEEAIRPIVVGWAQYFDGPMPAGAPLGPHAALIRALHASAAKTPSPGDGDAEEVDLLWEDEEDEDDAVERLAEGETRESLLDEVDRLATRGRFHDAERAFRAIDDAQPPSPEVDASPVLDEDTADLFLGLFAAAQSAFERAPVGTPGRRDFTAVERPIEAGDLAEHLAGRCALALRPRLPDGTCTLGVVDIDAQGPAVSALAYAKALQAVASAWGWTTLLEVTGGRGAHLWIPVAGRVDAGVMAHALARLVAAVGAPAAHVRVELLPGSESAVELHAASITLPLGVHVESGLRSRLEWDDGTSIDVDLAGIGHREATPCERLAEGAIVEGPNLDPAAAPGSTQPRLPWREFGPKVAAVMQGCAVLRHLAEKAAATGHLSHAERLSVLYTLGHLGERGHRAIHAIIRRCRNYDEQETGRQIGRLGGIPIGCTRMREKHVTPELAPQCQCPFDAVRQRGGYPTPVLHAGPFKRRWRQILRERDRPAVAPEGSQAGVTTMPAAPVVAPEGAVPGIPPHEWASPGNERR